MQPWPDWAYDFLTAGGLAGYLQGVGTIIAACIALIAYRRWRQPDDARRIADFAQELLKESRRLENKIRGLRTVAFLWKKEGTAEEKREKLQWLAEGVDFAKDRNELWAAESSFESFRTEAEVFCKRDVLAMIDRLKRRSREVGLARARLQMITGPIEGPNYASEAEMDHILRVLGVVLVPDGEDTRDAVDPYGEQLEKEGKELREALAKLLLGKRKVA